jgi:phenylacetic acid degradation operon negative regulatory protein
VPDRALRPRSGSSAKALLLTILGEFVLPNGGSAWTSTLVDALAALGVEERNARQAAARLAEQGLVSRARSGRRARWQLTEEGRELLVTGTDRIYGFGRAEDPWDHRWLVVLCSVPEEQRAKRHQLRTRLEFAGFGFLAPGVALSPHVDREQTANTVLEDLDLLRGAVVLRAEAGDLVPPRELLRRAWDLDALAQRYELFLTAFRTRDPHADAVCFADLAELVHEWRRFPFVDPEIPPSLLPDYWPGRRAKDLFDRCHAEWTPGAKRWYLGCEQQAG